MENSTDFNRTIFFPFRPSIWIIEIASSSALSVISVYLLLALLYYQLKVKKSSEVGFFQQKLEEKYKVVSVYTIVSIATFSAIRQLSAVGKFTVDALTVYSNSSEPLSNDAVIACQVLSQIVNTAIVGAGIMVNLFLWLRQSVFYVHPTLKVLNNKFLKVFSIFVLVSYFTIGTALAIAYYINVSYRLSRVGGCQFQEANADSAYLRIVIAWTISTIWMQVMLLALFIYPILKRSSWGKHHEDSHKNRLLRRVKKAIVLALICLISDIFALLGFVLLFEENSNDALFSYAINVVVNLLVTIFWFDYWKKLLWPWNVKCFKISTGEPEEASTSNQTRSTE